MHELREIPYGSGRSAPPPFPATIEYAIKDNGLRSKTVCRAASF
jgi:hypothetical protein